MRAAGDCICDRARLSLSIAKALTIKRGPIINRQIALRVAGARDKSKLRRGSPRREDGPWGRRTNKKKRPISPRRRRGRRTETTSPGNCRSDATDPHPTRRHVQTHEQHHRQHPPLTSPNSPTANPRHPPTPATNLHQQPHRQHPAPTNTRHQHPPGAPSITNTRRPHPPPTPAASGAGGWPPFPPRRHRRHRPWGPTWGRGGAAGTHPARSPT